MELGHSVRRLEFYYVSTATVGHQRRLEWVFRHPASYVYRIVLSVTVIPQYGSVVLIPGHSPHSSYFVMIIIARPPVARQATVIFVSRVTYKSHVISPHVT